MKINKLIVSKFINFLLISLKEFVQSAYRILSTNQNQDSISTVAELERSVKTKRTPKYSLGGFGAIFSFRNFFSVFLKFC